MSFKDFLTESSEDAIVKKAFQLIEILTDVLGSQVHPSGVIGDEGMIIIPISGNRQASMPEIKAKMKPEFTAVRKERGQGGTNWEFEFPDSVDYKKVEAALNKR